MTLAEAFNLSRVLDRFQIGNWRACNSGVFLWYVLGQQLAILGLLTYLTNCLCNGEARIVANENLLQGMLAPKRSFQIMAAYCVVFQMVPVTKFF